MLKIVLTLSAAIIISSTNFGHFSNNVNNNITKTTNLTSKNSYSNLEDSPKQYSLGESKSIEINEIENFYDHDITFSINQEDFDYFSLTKEVNLSGKINKNSENKVFDIELKPHSTKGNAIIRTKRSDSNEYQEIEVFYEQYKNLYFVSDVSENDLIQKIATFQLENEEISLYEYEKEMSDLFSLGSVEYEEKVFSLLNSDNSLQGKIQWIDDSDNSHSANYIKVELWDSDTGLFNPDDLLATTYTNSSGNYNFTYNNVDTNGGANGQDIYLKIFTESNNVRVQSSSSNSAYKFITDVTVDVSNGDNRNLNFSFNMDNTFGQAMQIVQAATYSAKYVEYLETNKIHQSNPSFVMPLVRVRYPYGDGAYYNGGSSRLITIPGPLADDSHGLHGYSSWDVIAHEYGHHVQEVFGISDNPGGAHYINANMADIYVDGDIHLGIPASQQYDIAKSKGVRLAWAEGWATYFAISVTKHFINRELAISNILHAGDSIYQANNGPLFNLDSFTSYGEASELTIFNFLYKLTYQSTGDSIVLPEVLLWQSIVLIKPITLSELVFELYNYEGVYYSYNDFCLLLEKFDLSPNNITVSFGYNQSAPPTIAWNKGGTPGSKYFGNDTFNLYITSKWANHLLVSKISLTSNSYTFNTEEWNIIKEEAYGEFYISISGFANNYYATGKYNSSQYALEKVSFSVLPGEYGFEQQYFYNTSKKSHDLANNKFTTSRFRTGYIENEYVVLSARKYNAGIANLEYSTGFPIKNISIEMAFWGQNEYLTSEDSTATIQYKNNEGSWIDIVNLLEDDILPKDRNSPAEISITFPTNIFNFRIYVQTATIGTNNKGRICVGELKFNPFN